MTTIYELPDIHDEDSWLDISWQYGWDAIKVKPSLYSKKIRGNDCPNTSWNPDALHSLGEDTIVILALRAKSGDAESAQNLARLPPVSNPSAWLNPSG